MITEHPWLSLLGCQRSEINQKPATNPESAPGRT